MNLIPILPPSYPPPSPAAGNPYDLALAVFFFVGFLVAAGIAVWESRRG